MPVSDPDRDGRVVVPAGRPATVWPCPPASPGRPPAGWLAAAVEQLVVTHTRPGDPVLLLTAPPQDGAGPRRDVAEGDASDGLGDTVWAVARLDRCVRVRTGPAGPTHTVAGSRPGLDPAPGRAPDAEGHPLVVSVVEPTRTGWLHGVPWARLVSPAGLLAVITRSDSIAGRLIDPTGDLTAATSRHGLALLDRVVLLEVPLDELDQPPTPLPHGTVARRVHSDMLLFAPLAPVPPTGGAAR
ncbi:hypothetical protein [Frankia gtarii]|uniref:hypothetical protein n=1 Tax=Frankia gtarii TaxID=2950102 RepID=UPI0021BFFFFE|nr:hypothetical protein [Frankia gtarii]